VEAAVAEPDVNRKLRLYHAIYRLNVSFANVVAQCGALRECGIWTRKDAHLYQSYAQELQADINARLAGILETVESGDHARFGKVTHACEKELRDPDDVFLLAEERRKEIARGKARPSARTKAKAASSVLALIFLLLTARPLLHAQNPVFAEKPDDAFRTIAGARRLSIFIDIEQERIKPSPGLRGYWYALVLAKAPMLREDEIGGIAWNWWSAMGERAVKRDAHDIFHDATVERNLQRTH
jgi:hypothetical protein